MGKRPAHVKPKRHRHPRALFCASCGRLVGRSVGADGDAVLLGDAGWVEERRRPMQGNWIMCGEGGCHVVYEHPLACSDECEDAVLVDAAWTETPMVRGQLDLLAPAAVADAQYLREGE